LEGHEPETAEIIGSDCASAQGGEASMPARPIRRYASVQANTTAAREMIVT